ncbi:MAG: T9SS type A sorting domain-containing protein [Ferruginibacter sp.]
MKKFFLSIALAISIAQAYSQTMSLILQYKAVPDSFYVSMVPTFSNANFNLGTSQVTIVFSNNFGINAPAATSIATTSSNTASWTAQDFALEVAAPNKKYVSFQTTGANIGSLTANTPKPLFRFRVTGAGGNCVGGIGVLRNYVNGFDLPDPAVTGSDFSTVLTDGLTTAEYYTTNSNTSMQTCAQLVLPVHLLEFDVRRDNNNAVINWAVIGEEVNSKYYELERSTDGITFKSVAQVDCRRVSGLQKYEYTDYNVNNLKAQIVYYRLRQYDLDLRSTLSGVRYIRMDVLDKNIQVYPNPVTEGFYVSIPFNNRDNSIVKLKLINASGQFIGSKEITTAQASNYYFNIKDKALASGDYFLQIMYEDKIIGTKKLTVNR